MPSEQENWRVVTIESEGIETVRVSDSATRIGQGVDGAWAWVRYDLGGWVAQARAQLEAPFDGPQEVSVVLDMSDEGLGDAVDLADAGGGVTAEVLRSLPLGDARKVLRRLRAEALARRDTDAYALPKRMVSLDDWVLFARAYARSASRNVQQPMAHLARATGLSPNTVAARVRRAQELGLLENSDGGWLCLAGSARFSDEER